MVDEKAGEILKEVKELKAWLYGENGFEGDIPEIKKSLLNHNKRINRIEFIIVGLLCSGGLGVGIINLLGN